MMQAGGVSPALRGLFVGSGSDGLNEPFISEAVISLAGKSSPSQVQVLYLGTATYDLPGPQERQTARFAAAGCSVSALALVQVCPTPAEIEAAVGAADVIIVSGGNTLFAVDRWRRLGVDAALRAAMERGAVLTGGSAGAICWFDGGHSDSADPDTFKAAMTAARDAGGDESSALSGEAKRWDYIRVPGLGLLPGLCCPHHDRVQSNGVPRSEDFAAMLARHPGERGVAIDHWAALQVLFPAAFGGVWVAEVVGGVVARTLCPPAGRCGDLFRPASAIEPDERVGGARAANPDDGPAPA